MNRPAQTNRDQEFRDRVRDTLRSHIITKRLTQRELAQKLGIDPTTLNNFLNRQTKALGGLAVALACTVVDLVCDGKKIGSITKSQNAEPVEELLDAQLVLEFDGAFELRTESK